MNYGNFKDIMIKYFIFRDYDIDVFNEEDMNDFYIIFKNMWFDTVEEWCDFYFKDWTLDTHNIELKSKISKP